MPSKQALRVHSDPVPAKTQRSTAIAATRAQQFDLAGAEVAFMVVESRARLVGLMAGIAGLGAGLVFSGCSSFATCEESRSCVAGSAGQSGSPAAGKAGAPSDGAAAGADSDTSGGSSSGGKAAVASAEAGAAGAAGDGSTAECVRDADCSNGLACDGVETCDAGTCRPGAPPCANPEPAHCDSVCEERKGQAVCSVRGKDHDKDGHFASSCVTHPGDDCDDSEATVYAGAPELCDDLDNDCNGKIDLKDGLGAGGTSEPIGPKATSRSLARITWASELSAYGIAYKDASSSQTADLYLEEVDQSGKLALLPTPFNDVDSKTPTDASLSLAWGGGAFGAAWPVTDGIYVANIGRSGGLPKPATYREVTRPGSVELARAADGSGVVVYLETVVVSTTYGSTVSPLGEVGNAVPLMTYYTGEASTVAAGNSFVVASHGINGGGPTSDASLWSADLTTSKVLPSVFDVKLASSSTGFAMVGRPTQDGVWQFSSFKLDGTTVCAPLDLPASFVPASLVATPTGYLVISSGAVKAQEILANCSLGVSFDIDPGPASDVHTASGPDGYGLVWQNTDTGIPMRRLFGSRYCD